MQFPHRGRGVMNEEPPLEQFPSQEFKINIPPSGPDIHAAYQGLRDQKDMVCGPYVLTYLLQAHGFETVADVPVTVDSVAAAAGAALETRNKDRQRAVENAIDAGAIPETRARTWRPHGHFDYSLEVAEEGGCSPEGLVEACEIVSDEKLTLVPVPAVDGETVQLTDDAFDKLLAAADNLPFSAQLIFNYNLKHTLAPTGLLGHRYNPLALFTQWDAPEYFRTLDWDVGHFTSLAGRITRVNEPVEYLLIRDSYRSFGWEGYHLQPKAYIREGLVRADDDRDGGVLLVVRTENSDRLQTYLAEAGLTTGLWDNGSPYLPHTDPFA